jgi:hypothetical protein
MLDPKSAMERRDREEPMLKKSRTLIEEPSLTYEKTDIWLPMLDTVLHDNEDPSETKSNTLMLEPNLT